jgi:hypothetical protein
MTAAGHGWLPVTPITPSRSGFAVNNAATVRVGRTDDWTYRRVTAIIARGIASACSGRGKQLRIFKQYKATCDQRYVDHTRKETRGFDRRTHRTDERSYFGRDREQWR